MWKLLLKTLEWILLPPALKRGRDTESFMWQEEETNRKGKLLKQHVKATTCRSVPLAKRTEEQTFAARGEKPQVCPTPCSGPVFLTGEEKQLQRSPPDLPSRSTRAPVTGLTVTSNRLPTSSQKQVSRGKTHSNTLRCMHL